MVRSAEELRALFDRYLDIWEDLAKTGGLWGLNANSQQAGPSLNVPSERYTLSPQTLGGWLRISPVG